jgi:hypothetical protein
VPGEHVDERQPQNRWKSSATIFPATSTAGSPVRRMCWAGRDHAKARVDRPEAFGMEPFDRKGRELAAFRD